MKNLSIIFLNLIVIYCSIHEFDLIKRKVPRKFMRYVRVSDNMDIENYVYFLEFQLGTPGQLVSFLVDTGSFVSWVEASSPFVSSMSSTFKGSDKYISLQYGIGNTGGTVSTDILSILNNKLTFKFLYAQGSSQNFEGLLGFGRVFNSESQTDPSFSLMNMLKSSKIIEKNIFAIKHINSTNAKMIIGDYPEEVTNYPSNYTTMRVNYYNDKRLAFWSGYLSYVLNGDVYDFNLARKIGKWVIFDSGSNNGYFPTDAKQNFVDLFRVVNSSICNWTSSFDISSLTTTAYYVCDPNKFSSIDNFPIFNYIFNGWAYRFETKTLFIDDYINFQTVKRFQILFQDSINEYIIGEPLLSKYLFVFDGEKSEVGIFGDFRYDFTKYTRDPPLKLRTWQIALIVIGCIIGLVLIIVIGCCIYCRMKRKNAKGVQINPGYTRF